MMNEIMVPERRNDAEIGKLDDKVSVNNDNVDVGNSDHGNTTPKATTTVGLVELPPELLRQIYSFMDIPMLGKMSQLHNGILRRFATEEKLWSELVRRRFHLPTTTKRPKTYGGKDWKHAYQNLHGCNRMPKSKYTNHKTVFAKGTSTCTTGGGKPGNSPSYSSKSSSSPSLSVWVTLYHTENCRTRLLRDSQRRYVEFWICFQNTKSSGPTIHVDITKCELQLLCSLGGIYSETCLQNQGGDGNCHGRSSTSRYRILHKQQKEKRQFNNNNNIIKDANEGIISLQPWELCIVSIPFPCENHDVFETDLLARAISLRVPYYHTRMTKITSSCDEKENKQEGQLVEEMMSEAWFISEGDVWDKYCTLPGGCLTLADRERRFHL